jgi:hypothetical protein
MVPSTWVDQEAVLPTVPPVLQGSDGNATDDRHRFCKELMGMLPMPAFGATDGAAGAARSRQRCYKRRLLVLPIASAGAAREQTAVLPAMSADATGEQTSVLHAVPQCCKEQTMLLQTSTSACSRAASPSAGAAILHPPVLQDPPPELQALNVRAAKGGKELQFPSRPVLLHRRWSSSAAVRSAQGIKRAVTVREMQGRELPEGDMRELVSTSGEWSMKQTADGATIRRLSIRGIRVFYPRSPQHSPFFCYSRT